MINTGQIAQLLRPGLKAVFGSYTIYDDQWKKLFKTYTSDKQQEIEVEMRYTGAAPIKPEGQPVAFDTMGQRIVTNYIHRTVALAFSITKEAIEDNLYKNQFPEQANSLRNSMRTTKNILAANIFNNAFDDTHPVGDGKALCAVDHPTDVGSYSNRLENNGASADFSEAAVEQAIIQIQRFTDHAGLLTQTMAKLLVLPRELQFSASRLLNSQFRIATANNDINAVYHDDYIPEGYTINQYLTSPTAWFIKTNAEDGLKHFQRRPLETDVYVDFPTDNLSAKATERYSFGVSNPRGLFGSPGVGDA